MKFKIVDNETGKSYVFEGDTAPTEAEIDQYLNKQTAQSPDESLLSYLMPQTPRAIQNLFNIPAMEKQVSQEIKQKGAFAAPSPKLRQLAGGTSVDTGNRFINSLLDAAKMTQTAGRAGTELGTGWAAVKALIPYLTYGGINKLKDEIANADQNAWKGKDIQDALVKELTSGQKLGNVKSEVETTVNDLLTRRMPGGFSNSSTYTTGDLNQFGKNIGMGEQGGYDFSSAPGMVRSATTGLVKNIAPATKFPYWASTQLNRIGGVPGVGGLLKNPITWPVAAIAGKKIPGVVKSVFGF